MVVMEAKILIMLKKFADKVRYLEDVINIKKPRVYIEIWSLQGGFDIQQNPNESGQGRSVNKNEMVLKAKMTGHSGIFESDLMEIGNNPSANILEGKKKSKSFKQIAGKISNISQDRRVNFIRPIGVQIEHASIYGKKAEISFSDPDGYLNSLLNSGDIIYIYTYNEGEQRDIEELKGIFTKGEALFAEEFYPELENTHYIRKREGTSSDGSPGIDLDDDTLIHRIHSFNLDFSGVITTHRQDISSSQQCRLEAVDGLKIFQHINVSTKTQKINTTSMKDLIKEGYESTNNWVVNDFTMLLIKAMYFCLSQYNDREWFDFLYAGRLDQLKKNKFENTFVRSSFDKHYNNVVQIVEVVGNNAGRTGRQVLCSHIFLAHPYVWIKALMIYINEKSNILSNFKINVIIPVEYRDIFDGYLDSILENLSFQGEKDDTSDDIEDDSVGRSKSEKLLRKNHRHIPLPDLLLGATFYNNYKNYDKNNPTPYIDWNGIFTTSRTKYADKFNMKRHDDMMKLLAFTYTANSGFTDIDNYTDVIANQLQLNINPHSFDYNGIMTICENFMIRRDRGIAGFADHERQKELFLNLIQRFNSNFVDLIMTNPVSIRSSKFNAKNTMYSEKTGKSNIDPTSSIPIPQLLQYAFGWFNPEPFYNFPFDIDNDNKDRKKKNTNYMYDISQSTWVQSDFFIRKTSKNAAVYLLFFPVMTSAYTNRFELHFNKSKNKTYIKYIPLSEVLEVDLTSMSTNNNFLIVTSDPSDGSGLYRNPKKLYNQYRGDILYYDVKNRSNFKDMITDDKDRNKGIKIQLFQENVIRKREINYRRRMEQFLYNHAPNNPRMRQPHGFSDEGLWMGRNARDEDIPVGSVNTSIPTDRIIFDDGEINEELTTTDMKHSEMSRIDPKRFTLFNWSDVQFIDDDYRPLDNGLNSLHVSENPPFVIVITFSDGTKKIVLETVFGGIPKSLSTADVVKYIDSKFANIPADIYKQIRILTNYKYNHDPLSYLDSTIDRGQSVSLDILRKQMIGSMKTTRKIMPTLPYDIILIPNEFTDRVWEELEKTSTLVKDLVNEPLYKIIKRIVAGIHLKGDEVYELVTNRKVLFSYTGENNKTVSVHLNIYSDKMNADQGNVELKDDIVALAKTFSYFDHVNRINNIMQTLSSIDIFMKVVLSRSSIGGKLYLKNWGTHKLRVGQEIGLIDDRHRVPLDAFPANNFAISSMGMLLLKKNIFASIKEVNGSTLALMELQDKIRLFIELQDKFTKKLEHHEVLTAADYLMSASLKNPDFRSTSFFVWKTVTYIGQSSSSAGSTSGYTQKVYMSDLSAFWNNKFEEDDFVSRMSEELIGRGFPLIEPSVFEEGWD